MRHTPNGPRRMRGRTTRAIATGAAVALSAGLLAACGSDDGGSNNSNGGDGPSDVTLKVGVFGQMDFTELYDQYMDENPHVTIEQNSIQENRDYYQALITRLPTGSGLNDIQALEVDNIYEMANDLGEFWVDLNETDADLSHFVDWKVGQATSADGRTIGFGTDIGPMAICYRTDRFEEAGLPTDRDEVGALWEGGWEEYIEVGQDFMAGTPGDVAFVDSSGGMFNAVLNGYSEKMYNAEGEVIYQDSEAVQTAWDLSVQVAEAEMSAQQDQFSEEWNRSFANGDFATVSCPAWMLGYIQDKSGADGEGNWDVTSAPLPSNWGGSFLAVPEASQHQEEAVKLAAWLTAPEQQTALFATQGNFPSSATAQESPEVADTTHEYFNAAPIGQIFSDAAQGIPMSTIGARDQTIREALTDGLVQIEQQGESADDAWDNTVRSIENALAD
ncbi:extracellular solute-binding protein [Streptomyces sp. ACA25]|uniref:ABC transporter substrate-binding protein n=1 Tax=Streptomyces sp. ACA25 TaxID=3022596 RepID=UPI0023077FB4|nr:extracellular solute-binding protein [Streptomyces sp. ACA25]MDB1087518.1 extracellular solute-binding protein [Streptomyces sp. ACA25]